MGAGRDRGRAVSDRRGAGFSWLNAALCHAGGCTYSLRDCNLAILMAKLGALLGGGLPRDLLRGFWRGRGRSELRQRVVGEYADHIRSFFTIRDERIRGRVDAALAEGPLWLDPLLQLSPAFEPGESIEQ